ncbi:hypothetical protein [Novilysobacter arseniciresistens]|uniref:hypothetical protein n=1 Tax=Novilysobacter arseniciresistens TaxID=1385522 RepID=UPI001939C83E|nr:hypothetical protein [Lysobacter arseniciresistens]
MRANRHPYTLIKISLPARDDRVLRPVLILKAKALVGRWPFKGKKRLVIDRSKNGFLGLSGMAYTLGEKSVRNLSLPLALDEKHESIKCIESFSPNNAEGGPQMKTLFRLGFTIALAIAGLMFVSHFFDRTVENINKVGTGVQNIVDRAS